MSDATIIDVTFVDAETAEPFLELKLPVRGLPKRDTTWTLGKIDWWIVDSTPERVEDIVKGGKVSLVLRKVQYVDPATILFSIPTVADLIPEEEVAGGSMANALILLEDDWLQLELVPRQLLPSLAAELTGVKEVLTNGREKTGFKRAHVRKAVPLPFATHPLALTTLQHTFGAERPLAYRGHSNPLKNCFAFGLSSGAWLYGQSAAGQVIALGTTTHDDEVLNRLEGLALIDWCAAKVS